MTHSGNGGKTRTVEDCLYVIAVGGSVLLCLGLLITYLVVGKERFPIDNTALILLFGVIAIALSHWFSRLRIAGVFELERLKKIEERQIRLLRGEVVRDEYDKRFYIDDAGERHLIPDDQTARFLRTSKGEIPVSTEDLEPYLLTDPMDSVLSCDLKRTGDHIFAILNSKKYHVGMDPLFDWGRHHNEDWQDVEEKELRRYPSGR